MRAEIRDYVGDQMHNKIEHVIYDGKGDHDQDIEAQARRHGARHLHASGVEPAAAVSVVGDFNGWNPFAHPLRVRANRTRSASVTVPSGSTLRFRYLADGGRWFDDDTLTPGEGEDAIIAV